MQHHYEEFDMYALCQINSDTRCACTNTDYISSYLLPLNLTILYLMLWHKDPNGLVLDRGLLVETGPIDPLSGAGLVLNGPGLVQRVGLMIWTNSPDSLDLLNLAGQKWVSV